jgi:hypothetical protein
MLFPMLNVVYFDISTSSSKCAVPSMAVPWRVFPARQSGIFWMFRDLSSCTCYYWYHFYIFGFHKTFICTGNNLYFRILSASFLIIFLSPEIATSLYTDVPFSLSRIMISFLLLRIVLSVRTFWFHNAVTLYSWLVSTDFGTWSYQGSLSNLTPFSFMC